MASKGCAFLMDMGTGKTITTIAVAGTLYHKHKICKMLVVCPKSLVDVWDQEFDKFADFHYQLAVLDGSMQQKADTVRYMIGGGLQVKLPFQPEDDVLGGRQYVDQFEMLVDHPDPAVESILRIRDGDRLTVHEDLALIRIIDAGDHVHQRGLAASVLAEDGKDLPVIDIQGDMVVGDDLASERLRDVLEFKRSLFLRHHSSLPSLRP